MIFDSHSHINNDIHSYIDIDLTISKVKELEDLDKLDKWENLEKLARCIRQLAEATTLPSGGDLQRYPIYRRFQND